MYFGLHTRLREFFVKSSSWTLRVLRKETLSRPFGSTGRVHKCVETRIPCPRFPVASFFPDSPLAGGVHGDLTQEAMPFEASATGAFERSFKFVKKRNAKIIHAMMMSSAKASQRLGERL